MSAASDDAAPPAALSLSKWFSEQVHPHEAHLRSYLHGTFPAVHDVDDVVQEAYLRVWKARRTQPILSAKAFLFTVAKRIALNVVRRNRTSLFESLDDARELCVPDEKANAADTLCEGEKIAILADAVMSLPPRCREIVILRKLQGLRQKEVAERLGLSERTIETQTRIGVGRCLSFLKARGVVDFFTDEK